jgi:hypothetical protein
MGSTATSEVCMVHSRRITPLFVTALLLAAALSASLVFRCAASLGICGAIRRDTASATGLDGDGCGLGRQSSHWVCRKAQKIAEEHGKRCFVLERSGDVRGGRRGVALPANPFCGPAINA